MIPGETILSGGAVDRHTSPFKVMQSGGGWYVGTTWGVCDEPECKQEECVEAREGLLPKNYSEPNSRETDYFETKEGAIAALASFHASEEHILPAARTPEFKPAPFAVIELSQKPITEEEARDALTFGKLAPISFAEPIDSIPLAEEIQARERRTYRPMPTSDPAHWMLERGREDPSFRSKKTVHRAGCYICEDPEFALMGLPLCYPCAKCGGHVPADDSVCSDCKFDHSDLPDVAELARREAAEEPKP